MMKKRTYVYVGGFEMPDKNAAAHRVTSIGKILRVNQCNVIYIGTDHGIDMASDVLSTQSTYNGFECYAVGYPKSHKDWIEYLTSAGKYIKVIQSIKYVNGLIFYNFPSIAMRNLMVYCEKHAIKCYADVTEWYSSKGQGLLWGLLKGSDSWYRMRVLHKKMDGMIVVSSYLKWYYRKQPNVIRIPVLADLKDEKWKNHYQKSQNVLKLAYAGWPKKKDRLDYLVEALIKVNRPYHLDVVGITMEQYLKMYPQHKGWLKGNDNITFYGRISHEETLDIVKQANYSCFFRPDNRMSKAGFPTKFVEAVCCGTPVITNDTSDLKYYIQDGKNAYIINSYDGIAKCIDQAEYEKKLECSQFDYMRYVKKVRRWCGINS